MSTAVVTITTPFVEDNSERLQRFIGTLTIGPSGGNYPVGGIPIEAVLAAALAPLSSGAPKIVNLVSLTGSGYIYTYIQSTGCVQILQAPPSGSLSTAGPLQQLGAGATLSQVASDTISFDVTYERNE
jgi:hypothetical protein